MPQAGLQKIFGFYVIPALHPKPKPVKPPT